jgi:septum formation protein
VRASELAEVAAAGEAPADFARRVAREKGAEVSRRCPGAWVLSADTVVVADGLALGKPADAAEARRMLERLAGRGHEVLTAVALIAPSGQLAGEELVRTEVWFRPLSAAEVAAYVATGEPLDKAGAYGIQGGARGFVERWRGSFSNVVGLPLDEVRALLAAHGLLAAPAGAAARR